MSAGDFSEEQLDLDQVEEEKEDDSLPIDRPFDPEKIKVRTVGRTVDLLVRRIRHNEIDLAPAFQRRARVWDIGRRSRLIESLLLRIPLPVFYVAADEAEMWAVVDGLQRLTTILDFMSEEFSLAGLEYLTQLNGRRFSSLPRPMQRRIEETELVIHVIEPGTPEAVMINIFKRINTGGLSLTGQEIRNALNRGVVREFLPGLAGSREFLQATDGGVRDDRMDAQECVLRFIAFRYFGWRNYDQNNLDGFLNAAMRAVNGQSPAELHRVVVEFKRAMNAAWEIFGRNAFRKMTSANPSRRSQVSKALFEAWSVNLAELTDDQIGALVSNRQMVVEAFVELLRKDRFFEISISYSTGTPQRVHKRFSSIHELVRVFI